MGRYSPSELKLPVPPTIRSRFTVHRADFHTLGDVAGIELRLGHVGWWVRPGGRWRCRFTPFHLNIDVFLDTDEVDDAAGLALIERTLVALDERLHEQKQDKGGYRSQPDTENISYQHVTPP